MRKQIDFVNKVAGDPSMEVLDQIHTIMHLVRAQQFRGLRDAEQGLTHMESKTLGFFARHPGATQKDLATHTGRDKGQLARLIGGLRERGLLEARADAADGRSVRLHLTAEGEAAAQAVRRQARRVATVAVQGLDAADSSRLLALLGRVRANLEGVQEPD